MNTPSLFRKQAKTADFLQKSHSETPSCPLSYFLTFCLSHPSSIKKYLFTTRYDFISKKRRNFAA